MIIKTTKIADTILMKINKLIKKDKTLLLYAYPYHNGRERGWQLINSNKGIFTFDRRSIVFSENRNSDQIVIYCGLENEFNNAIPSDKVYANKTFFRANNYNEIVKFGLKYLLS